MHSKWRRRHRKRCNNKGKIYIFLILILFAGLGGGMLYKWVTVIEPNIDKVSVLKANGIINQRVNSALISIVADWTEEKDRKLLEIVANEEGGVEFAQANAYEINKFKTELSKALQKAYDAEPDHTVKVPVGTLYGSKVLSGFGPEIEMKISTMAVTSTSYVTEFENQGINQTKYKLYMTIKTRMMVFAPFYKNEFDIDSTIFIAEAVIVGKVPQSYVVVPKDDILDAVD